MNINRETYINLIHRMTNYDEDVIKEYLKSLDVKTISQFGIKDIYNLNTYKKLYYIERYIKINKLINNTK